MTPSASLGYDVMTTTTTTKTVSLRTVIMMTMTKTNDSVSLRSTVIMMTIYYNSLTPLRCVRQIGICLARPEEEEAPPY